MKSYKTLREEGHGFFKIISYVVIIAFLISIFVIGSLSTMLGKDRVSFIDVNGKEIMNKRLVEAISEKIKDQKNKIQVQYTIFTESQPFVNKELIISELQKSGLYPRSLSLINVVNDIYNQEKTQFEKKENTRYPYSLEDFINIFKERYSIELFDYFSAISYIDDVTLKREYRLENIKASVKYYALSFNDYSKNIKISSEEIMKEYNEVKSRFLESISARYVHFKKIEEASNFLQDIRSGKINKTDAFKNSKISLFKPNDTKEFFKLKAANVNDITDPFEYNNGFAVALIDNINYTPYDKLSDKDKNEIKDKIINSNRQKYFDEFRKYAGEVLNKDKIDPKNVITGITKPFSILADETVKADNGKPIEWAEVENKEFFKEAFTKEGYVSPIKEWGDYIYKIEVLKIEMPGPISEKDRETMISRLKEREKRRFEWGYLQDLRKKFDVKYNWEALSKLFGIEGK
ncbi:MAG TPA: hypothetical protein PKW55_03230 [Spirochaetota bacterium]|nr:hypothetical protein [Spirochaetota bacterium]HOM39238.1 hypothetical protein [Spirochaetota bacterium]HPQ48645.1 hypothetical protein [Spirochaetota bacterium]